MPHPPLQALGIKGGALTRISWLLSWAAACNQFHDLLFGLSQGPLVGYLIKASIVVASFSVQAADSSPNRPISATILWNFRTWDRVGR